MMKSYETGWTVVVPDDRRTLPPKCSNEAISSQDVAKRRRNMLLRCSVSLWVAMLITLFVAFVTLVIVLQLGLLEKTEMKLHITIKVESTFVNNLQVSFNRSANYLMNVSDECVGECLASRENRSSSQLIYRIRHGGDDGMAALAVKEITVQFEVNSAIQTPNVTTETSYNDSSQNTLDTAGIVGARKLEAIFNETVDQLDTVTGTTSIFNETVDQLDTVSETTSAGYYTQVPNVDRDASLVRQQYNETA